jgi:hypothetical protein
VPKSLSNRAFFFIEPHANTPPTIAFVQDWLSSLGLQPQLQATLTGELLLEKFKMSHKEHSRFGLTLRCSEYSVSHAWRSAFHLKFGTSWAEALEKSLLYNAADCMKFFNLSAEDLQQLWLSALSLGRVLVLDRHFHCALLDSIPGKGTVICVNGYLPALLEQYRAPTASVTCFNVEWEDDRVMTWPEFMQRIIGDMNPSQATDTSLRRIIANEWEELCMESPPDLINSGIYASVGAFEAFVDRSLWLDAPWLEDPVGCQLYPLGLTPSIVTSWLGNPLVDDNRRLFGVMEGLGTEDTLLRAKEVLTVAAAAPQGPSAKQFTRPKVVSSLNSALVFLKPSLSRSQAAVGIVKDFLMTKGFILSTEGILSSLSDRIVDRHFSMVAEAAMTLHPRHLKFPAASFIQFQKKFSTSWGQELNAGRVMNAAQMAHSQRIDYVTLAALWAEAQEADRVLELGNCIFCGLLRVPQQQANLFCINGFYPELRLQYTAPSATVHFFQVEWVSHLTSWEHFLTRVIGKGDKRRSHPSSITHLLQAEWQTLRLMEPPQDCLHASASAFEAMAELSNWLSQPISESLCGRRLLEAGIPLEVLTAWCRNPLLQLQGTGGVRVFDKMRGHGTDECLDVALHLLAATQSQSQVAPAPLVAAASLYRSCQQLPPLLDTPSSQLPPRSSLTPPLSLTHTLCRYRSPVALRESSLASQLTPQRPIRRPKGQNQIGSRTSGSRRGTHRSSSRRQQQQFPFPSELLDDHPEDRDRLKRHGDGADDKSLPLALPSPVDLRERLGGTSRSKNDSSSSRILTI